MHRALDIGGRQAAVYTPIDTKTLINSQFRGVEVKGTLFTGACRLLSILCRFRSRPECEAELPQADSEERIPH